MSMTLESVPFFSHDLVMKEITEASRIADFRKNGRALKSLGGRLNNSSLDKIVGTKEYILTLSSGDFIRFEAKS